MASMAKTRPAHLFIRNSALGWDHRGRSYCIRCNLPDTSARHRVATEFALDAASRAAGERPDPDDEEGSRPVTEPLPAGHGLPQS